MEDFGYQKEEEKSHILRLIKKSFMLSATLLSISAFIYVTITAYDYVNQDESEIEVIESPEEPIKVIEEERADININELKNNSIYDDLFGNSKESLAKNIPKIRFAPEPAFPPQAKAERIFGQGAREQFVAKDGPANLVVDTDDSEVKKPAEQRLLSQTNNGRQDQRIVVYSDQNKETGANKDFLTKGKVEPQMQRTTQNIPEKTAASNKKNSRRYVRVQIAALTSKKAADDYWKKISRANSKLFSELKPYTETVDLGKRGIFYRLQVGNFSDQVGAEDFCTRYTSQTQRNLADCIVVE